MRGEGGERGRGHGGCAARRHVPLPPRPARRWRRGLGPYGGPRGVGVSYERGPTFPHRPARRGRRGPLVLQDLENGPKRRYPCILHEAGPPAASQRHFELLYTHASMSSSASGAFCYPFPASHERLRGSLLERERDLY